MDFMNGIEGLKQFECKNLYLLRVNVYLCGWWRCKLREQLGLHQTSADHVFPIHHCHVTACMCVCLTFPCNENSACATSDMVDACCPRWSDMLTGSPKENKQITEKQYFSSCREYTDRLNSSSTSKYVDFFPPLFYSYNAQDNIFKDLRTFFVKVIFSDTNFSWKLCENNFSDHILGRSECICRYSFIDGQSM